MRSMTGYGRGQAEKEGRALTIEVKSVNHRFLDVNLRLPRGLLFLEDPIRRALAERLGRGHVDVFLTYVNTREDAREVVINTSILNAYINALSGISDLVDYRDDRSLMAVSALPDVLAISEKEEDQETLCALALQALHAALDALVHMREREGAALGRDVAGRLERLRALAGQMAERAPEVVMDYRTRLQARIEELLELPPDPQRIAQEVAIMADRAAIDEELVRLQCHIEQFENALLAEEPIGRKLDFLVQELHREINTVGSKASDLQIGTWVVDGKAEVEKIREQVQNIE